MSALQENTSAVLTLCALTPRDLTTVLVIQDTMETEKIAKVIFVWSGKTNEGKKMFH